MRPGQTTDGKFRVDVTDGSGYASNALRFDTAENARTYAVDLAWRWTAVRDWRVVNVDTEEIIDSMGGQS